MVIKFLFNAEAGNAKGMTQAALSAAMEEYGLPYEWISLDDLPGLVSLAQHTRQPQYLILVGGDGTLHRIMNTIGHRNLHLFTFGIIPMGTGNDFARSLKLPLNPNLALESLLQSHVHTVDMGLINQRLCFTCAASLGFGPQVTKIANKSLKSILGRGALYWGAFSYLFRKKLRFKLTLRIDNLPPQKIRTPHLVVGNAKYHGGGFPIAPLANLKSNLLELYYLRWRHWWEIPKLYFTVFVKKQDHTLCKEVYHQRLKSIELRFTSPLEMDVDGDIYTFYRKINIDIHPEKLRVMAPPWLALEHEPVESLPWKLVGRNSRAS
jgi:diacylglycerol kinase (ATP)